MTQETQSYNLLPLMPLSLSKYAKEVANMVGILRGGALYFTVFVVQYSVICTVQYITVDSTVQ